MKYIFLAALTIFNLDAMNKPYRPKKTTPPPSFNQLSSALLVALKDIDVPRTRNILKDLASFKKNTEELRCLESKVTSYLQALLFNIQERSKATAQLMVHSETMEFASKLNPPIVQKHADTLLLQEIVHIFFTEHWREQTPCLFTPLTPITQPASPALP